VIEIFNERDGEDGYLVVDGEDGYLVVNDRPITNASDRGKGGHTTWRNSSSPGRVP